MVHRLLIHGLNGSGRHSSTGKTLRAAFGAQVHTPDFPLNPTGWFDAVCAYIDREVGPAPALVFLGCNDEVLDYRRATELYQHGGEVVLTGQFHQYRLSEDGILKIKQFADLY